MSTVNVMREGVFTAITFFMGVYCKCKERIGCHGNIRLTAVYRNCRERMESHENLRRNGVVFYIYLKCKERLESWYTHT